MGLGFAVTGRGGRVVVLGLGEEIRASTHRRRAYLPQAFSVSITKIINAISGQLPEQQQKGSGGRR